MNRRDKGERKCNRKNALRGNENFAAKLDSQMSVIESIICSLRMINQSSFLIITAYLVITLSQCQLQSVAYVCRNLSSPTSTDARHIRKNRKLPIYQHLYNAERAIEPL